MQQVLQPTHESKFPFAWANLESYRDSKAYRKEIYLKDQSNIIDGLIQMFYFLFKISQDSIVIFNKSWGDFCLDTWDITKDVYNYSLEGKCIESQEYLRLLMESRIETRYSGICICNNWHRFLDVILRCIVHHKAPYSPLFCDIDNQYFFYFHATGSIGIYYENENSVMRHVLLNSSTNYLVRN